MTDDTLIFEGSLLELPSDAPRCGDVQVAVAHRFHVIRVLAGRTTNETAIVLIPCPELLGARFFESGAHYRIEASSDLRKAGAYTIYNDYGEQGLLWCLRITRLES
jgi:hypothetical protein